MPHIVFTLVLLSKGRFNLESSVEREKDVQGIDVHREFEKSVVTLLVMSIFSNFLGALRACADFRDSTEESRFKLIGTGVL